MLAVAEFPPLFHGTVLFLERQYRPAERILVSVLGDELTAGVLAVPHPGVSRPLTQVTPMTGIGPKADPSLLPRLGNPTTKAPAICTRGGAVYYIA